jgi:hypothetical protein
LGGTTAVVIAFIAPSIFWERFVGFMYPWRHPRKLFARFLLGFAAFVAALSLPSLLIDLLGDLYATTWYVPVYTGSANFGHWDGGIKSLAEHEAAAARTAGGIGASIGASISASIGGASGSGGATGGGATGGDGSSSRGSRQPAAVPEVVNTATVAVLSALDRSSAGTMAVLERAHGKPSASKSNATGAPMAHAPTAPVGSGRAPQGTHQHQQERAGAAARPTPPKRRRRRR